MAQRPLAYQGREPFVFISYAHRDADLIYPLIIQLQNEGLRVWYDEGLEVGSHWDSVIPQHIQDSACMICFITKNFLLSENCLDEMHFAREEKKGPLIVYMESVNLPVALRFRYGRVHALSREKFANDASFVQELCNAEILRSCRDSAVHIPASDTIESNSKPDQKATDLYNQGWQHQQKQEYDRALSCYRKAAEQGVAASMSQVGFYYEMGYAVQKDYQEAVKWYRKAAEKGQKVAQNNLANCYWSGRGVQYDLQQAVYWYQKSAEQGYENAQYMLGNCYQNGYGVPQDFEQARYWYQKAADQGYTDAENALKRLK